MWARNSRRATIAVAVAAIATLAAACSSGAGERGRGRATRPLTFEVAIAVHRTGCVLRTRDRCGLRASCLPDQRRWRRTGAQVQVPDHEHRGRPRRRSSRRREDAGNVGHYRRNDSGPAPTRHRPSCRSSTRLTYQCFPVTGQPSFNTSTYGYFWRTLPADNQLGYAMAAWRKQKGYSKAAALFRNDVGGQAQVPGLVAVTAIGLMTHQPRGRTTSPPTGPRLNRSWPPIPGHLHRDRPADRRDLHVRAS